MKKNSQDNQFTKNEKQILNDLIFPFFNKVLRWEIESPDFQIEEVVIGQRIDCTFYHKGITQFVLEARYLHIKDLRHNYSYYKQTINYAKYKVLRLGILTNFRHIILLRCDIGLSPLKTEIAFIYVLRLEEESEKFDLFWDLNKEVWLEKDEKELK